MKRESDPQFNIEDMIRKEVPHFVDSNNPDIPGLDSDAMDKAICEFTDESRQYLKEQDTVRDWQESIFPDGSLFSIYRELHRALDGSKYIQRELNRRSYNEMDLRKDLAYGLRIGSENFESGNVIAETPEVGKIRMSTADTYTKVGMTTDSDNLFEYYENIADEFYDEGLFREVALYAEENLYTRNRRFVFMTVAAIGLKLYADARDLRQFNLLLYGENDSQ